jgi:hypothetical protein
MRRLKVGVLDLLTNTPNESWFHSHVMAPSFGAIMPQCVAAWAEELGHEVHFDAFTGREDLDACMPPDLDVLFVSCFSRASFLAYGISEYHRRRGVVTVLGGPHARSFPAHSRQYFDYVTLLTDKPLIRSLLQGCSPQRPGLILGAKAQPKELPGMRQRSRFVEKTVKKGTPLFRAVPVLGSLGCPYTCSFCVDAPIPYQPMPFQELVDDLRYTQERFGRNTMVGWHDPNFGVRFKDYMHVIEESGTRLLHIAESSLSLLGEDNLKALQRNNFAAMLPGVESWFDFNAKGGARKLVGREKVVRVAEHLNLIQSYVPYVQANFVLGLDCDAGEEPWELTKEFVDRAPGILPGFSLITDFQNSPLSAQLRKDRRTTCVPYALLDNNFASNVKLKNYGPIEFYDRTIDLMEHAWSWSAIAKRFRANPRPTVKILNVGRGLTEGRDRLRHHREMRQRLVEDAAFRRFAAGEVLEPPAFFFEAIRSQLGRYSEWLPPELLTPAGFVRSEERADSENVAVA